MKHDARFLAMPECQRSPEQQLLAEGYRTGWRSGIANPDGSLGGPSDATLRSPRLAERLNGVGDYFGIDTTLAARFIKFVILVLARQINSPFEWHARSASALQAGVVGQTIETLAHSQELASIRENEAVVRDVVLQRPDQHLIDNAIFARVRLVLGDKDPIDLLALCGYYGLVAMLLGAADVSSRISALFEIPTI